MISEKASKAGATVCAQIVITTLAQLSTYDVAKASVMIYHPAVKDLLGTQSFALFVVGLTAATVRSSLDVVKMKLMSAKGRQRTLQLLRDCRGTRRRGVHVQGRGPELHATRVVSRQMLM